MGIAGPAWGFSCWTWDYDNDGWLDIFATCYDRSLGDMVKGLLGQPHNRHSNRLYRNHEGRSFQHKTNAAKLNMVLVTMGSNYGDFDNDGSVDVLVTQNNGAPILLRNNAGRQDHWLGVKLVGRKANIDAIGAKLTWRSGDFERHQFKVGGGSYLSSHDPRIVLGIGQRRKIDWLEVKWPQPSGKLERFTDLPIDGYITIVEGEGKWK
jgi:hypothetical protein